MLQILKYSPLTRSKIPALQTQNNLPHSTLVILLPRSPKVPSPLKPSASPHQNSTRLSFSMVGIPPFPICPKLCYSPDSQIPQSLQWQRSQQYHDHLCPWRTPHLSLYHKNALSAAYWETLAQARPATRVPEHIFPKSPITGPTQWLQTYARRQTPKPAKLAAF